MNTIDSLRRAATAQATTPEERAEDERNRFITANAELGLLCVRQGYALRVLRGAAKDALDASKALHELKESVTPEASAPELDVNAWVRSLRAAEGRLAEAVRALVAALDETAEESKAPAPVDIATEIEALKPLASRAYRRVTLPSDADAAKHLAEPIRPGYDADNDESPRLVLAFDLGGMAREGEPAKPWQASVQYEGGMGAMPVICGNACVGPLEAIGSLRASLEIEDAKPLRGDEGSDD
jgi:hypothetical protein